LLQRTIENGAELASNSIPQFLSTHQEIFMFTVPEQFSAATKANFEAQLALITSLSNKAFESAEKLVSLNMSAAKASLEESTVAAKQLIAAKDPQEFFTLASSQAQPNAEKALAFGRQLSSIFSSTQADYTKAAEAQIAETNRKVISLIDDVTKNAPAGSENAIAMMKSAIGNANAGYEQLTKTTKQAVEALESNLTNAINQFSQAAQKVAPAAAGKK
jgi:phasin family protein